MLHNIGDVCGSLSHYNCTLTSIKFGHYVQSSILFVVVKRTGDL